MSTTTDKLARMISDLADPDLDAQELLPMVCLREADLHGELARTPADLAYLGMLASQAEHEHAEAKAGLERIEAQAQFNARALAAGEGRKLTELMAEALVDSNDVVLTAKSLLARAAHRRGVVKALCGACQTKASLLQSLTGLHRAEMQLTR